MKGWFATVAVAFLVQGSLLAQQFPHPQPATPRDFVVMPWDNTPSDPELLQGMKDAGMNMAGFCGAEDVERVRAAGLTCVLRDPRLSNYDWKKLPPEDQIRKDVAELAREFGSNPTVLGFFLNDEPRTPEMPALGRVVALLREAMPDKLPYVNLFPYREGEQEWYTNYEDYAKALVDVVHQPIPELR